MDMRRRTTEDCCGMFAVLARTRPSHLSGLDPKLGVERSKGTSKGNSYHRERERCTCKHMCILTHNSGSCGGHLYISPLISIPDLFVLLILSVMLTSR